MAETRNVDWERIEREYRAGLLSVREIGVANGVSHVAIQKRAKRDGWDRDLTAKIRAKADAMVTKAEVSTVVTKEQMVTERQIVDAGAITQAGVRLSQRSDIRRTRNLVIKLLAELEAETGDIDLFGQLGELMHDETEGGSSKRSELYARVLSLPSRTKVLKDLADALRILVAMEREAYGIDAVPEPPEKPPIIDVSALTYEQRQQFRAILTAAMRPAIEGEVLRNDRSA